MCVCAYVITGCVLCTARRFQIRYKRRGKLAWCLFEISCYIICKYMVFIKQMVIFFLNLSREKKRKKKKNSLFGIIFGLCCDIHH